MSTSPPMSPAPFAEIGQSQGLQILLEDELTGELSELVNFVSTNIRQISGKIADYREFLEAANEEAQQTGERITVSKCTLRNQITEINNNVLKGLGL